VTAIAVPRTEAAGSRTGAEEPRIAGADARLAVTLANFSGLSISLLENGAVFAIRHDQVLVNQVLGSPVEGALGNLYLRRRTQAGITFVPLMGPGSDSRFRATQEAATWEGAFEGVSYLVTLRLHPTLPTWFWTVDLVNGTRRHRSMDAILAQDLGIATEDVVRSSEAYTSQYIDHTVLRDPDLGYLVCSRQNMPQGGAIPWLMHGCLEGAAGFLTDAFQLYGLDYKATNVPVALGRRTLPNHVYQYEAALPTVQSLGIALAAGASRRVTFFAAFRANHPSATGPEDAAHAATAGEAFRSLPVVTVDAEPVERAAGVFDAPALFTGRDLTDAELAHWFGTARRHEERRGGQLLSFFHGRSRHVVLRAKELVSERPTGLIMRSGRHLFPSDDTLSVTAWMSGVFASQLTIGNTSFNKLLSVARHPLNALKSSGQRIFLRTGQGWELLGLASAMEMAPNRARWIYVGAGRTIVVTVVTSLDNPACRTTIDVEAGGPVELLLTHNVVLGANEHDVPGIVRVRAPRPRVEMRPAPSSVVRRRYPDTTFALVSPDRAGIAAIGGDELLYADGVRRDGAFVVLQTRPVEHLSVAITGSILDVATADALATRYGTRPDPHADNEAESDAFWSGLARGAVLGGASGTCADDLARLNDLIPWYLHNAMIHYTAPHGQEQYSGAAWGLRDVCQGPVELLVATGNTGPLRDVIRLVYAHQYRRSGDWPQWFMFDRFRDVQSAGSHADIIHWPIKAICDYVEATGDATILEDVVDYTADDTFGPAGTPEPILAHAERQVARIEHDCIPGTSLPVFAGGDWEDTLQPADPAAARRLVSSWTVELAYQTLGRFRVVCERAGATALAERLAAICVRLRADFNTYLVPDGVVAGLADFAPQGIEYLLHPRDQRTGVEYRLLPMTRGIIAELFTPEQARRHAGLVRSHLLFPDGVRLEDRPVVYHGGPSRTFRRAETAANFGREVGLGYTHAHIRYVEAMAKLGRADAAFDGLLRACPILLDRDVPASLPRQSNSYFSSSDAAFTDRWQAHRRFGWIRSGRVGLKGGWRVYSSGPGIFLNQLISNVLGLRRSFDDMVFDPVLPRRADGLTFDTEVGGRPVRYLFHVTGDGFSPREVLVNGTPLPGGRYAPNPYRAGGLLVEMRAFHDALDPAANLVEVSI
jgi:1,2-beta-oligoglucan phosphorylase